MILDGYVRVSHVGTRAGESFISPAVQREQIAGWVKLHGHLVSEIFEELDESGARRDRPLLEHAIRRVERGESHGIVVAKLDRFGRSLVDGLAAIERITKAGGTFASVQDGLDFTTDTGRLVLRIMLSMAEWELDRIRSTWAEASARAVARGVCIGPPPIGYRRLRSGRLRADPVFGPLVTELFRRRADGEQASELARSFRDRGLRTPSGAEWSASNLHRLLRKRVYLGEVRYGNHVKEAAHQPLTDKATWQRAQQPPEWPRHFAKGEPALLRGLLRCASCGRLLSSGVNGLGSTSAARTYGCKKQSVAGPCESPAYIRDSVVEPYVEAIFWQELSSRKPAGGVERLRQLKEDFERHERELERYRDSPRVAQTLTADQYERGLCARSRRLEQALLELASARRGSSPPQLPPVDELRPRWPTMTVTDRRRAFAELIDCVLVVRGHGRKPVEDRVFVYLRGSAPPDLPPIRPRCFTAFRRFDPAACPSYTGLRSRRPWSQRRLRTELAAFVHGRADWPSFLEFQAAGRAMLYAQVVLHGGPIRWARRLGRRYEAAPMPLAGWSEERVRRELRRFLRGKHHWPTVREFKTAHCQQLRQAIVRFGGPERWAKEFGLRIPPGQRPTREMWTDERIEAALREFTAGRTTWPPRREFVEAGLLRLCRRIGVGEERERWARRLGLRIDSRVTRTKKTWTEDTIEKTLRRFLRGRDYWPSVGEFRAAGLYGLHQNLGRSPGGHNAWAHRYGLPRASRR